MNKYDTEFLDEEEKELIESIDGLDYETLSEPEAKEQDKIQEAAGDFVSAPRKANIGKLENPARVTINHRHGTEP